MQYSFTAKMTVDVYSKATIPVKSNTLQKFRTLVQCINTDIKRQLMWPRSATKLKGF